jgi:hypothetical protein
LGEARGVSVLILPFKYADGVAPAGYGCGGCDAHGVKLWRDYQTFLDHQTLLCATCAEDEQEKPRGFALAVGNGDQIGWRVPAVPTEDGETFWGYSSVPADGVRWWKVLRSRPGT